MCVFSVPFLLIVPMNAALLGERFKMGSDLTPFTKVTSILLTVCESWTLKAELQKRIQAMEMRCYHKKLRISYKDHVTNEEVYANIQQAVRPHEDILTVVKRHKLKWYGHVCRSSGLAKTVLQGTVKGGTRRGRQKERWEDNVREWTGLEETACELICGTPTTPRLRDR